MTLPQLQNRTFERRQERREMRYPLHLPVLIKMAREEMRARSENISLGGILLSSDYLIPEGTTVDVTIGVKHMPDPGILLSARGKVLRAQPTTSGEFALAIRLENSFELPMDRPKQQDKSVAIARPIPERTINVTKEYEKNRNIFYRAPYVTAWSTET